MSEVERVVGPLREALRFSPDNQPLRLHLAETLLRYGELDEAEQQFREALQRGPNDSKAKLGLATTFYRAGKPGPALVLVETLLDGGETPADALVLHARLMLRAGEVQRAVYQYRAAIDLDPTVADEELAELLGISPNKEADGDEREVVEGRVRTRAEASEASDKSAVERPKIKFEDVGGMEPLKEQIRLKIIYPLEHAEMYRAYGKTIGGGILMYGPPGCGKTHLARATAGEIQASFINVGISDVLDMWLGNSERNLHALFEQARRQQPCVLFFDEVDALGASRADLRQSAGRNLINQFLAELDGADASNDGLLVLGATNAPWHLDSAFLRPGRFDRIVFVPPPDAEARACILRVLLKGKPVADLDCDLIAAKWEGFSGADLKAVIDAAIETKLVEAMRSGKPSPIAARDLAAAAKQTRNSTTEWFATARNYALYSNQGGLYDDILQYLGIKR